MGPFYDKLNPVELKSKLFTTETKIDASLVSLMELEVDMTLM